MSEIVISHHTLSCAAGEGLEALGQSLSARESGLSENDFPYCDLNTWIGRVRGIESVKFDGALAGWESRNNALTLLGYDQDGFSEFVSSRVKKLGAQRVGIVVGTSTSSIGRTEEAYRHFDSNQEFLPQYVQKQVHTPHCPSAFLAKISGILGPAMTVSTACSSSAKVFATATRWLNAGLVDAVLVGGVDSLCLSVLHGFDSLQLVSENPCRPFDEHRDGINLGEAAGFAFVEKRDVSPGDLVVSGYGESSDAHHMSHPHPEGLGAEMAMTQALARANLQSKDIGYVNLHGTASRVNDAIETGALRRLFPETTRVSSTKGWTGHTLGAAGIAEVVISLEALKTGLVPGTLNMTHPDPDLSFPVMQENERLELQNVMSNSFGFGGNNCSVVLSRVSEEGALS